MFTSLHPVQCALALDDRTLNRAARKFKGLRHSEPFYNFAVAVAGEYFHRTGKSTKLFLAPFKDEDLVVPNLTKDYNFDFTWMWDTPKAYRCWMRARWKLYEPTWHKRGPPPWIDDYTNHSGSDAQQLCVWQRHQIGFQPHPAKGRQTCVACGGTVKWRCPKDDNRVSFRCIDQPCIKWAE